MKKTLIVFGILINLLLPSAYAEQDYSNFSPSELNEALTSELVGEDFTIATKDVALLNLLARKIKISHLEFAYWSKSGIETNALKSKKNFIFYVKAIMRNLILYRFYYNEVKSIPQPSWATAETL